MKKIFVLILLLLTGIVHFTLAGEKELPTLKPFLILQQWSMYSTGFYTGEEAAAPRFSGYLRRGRTGLRGHLIPSLSYDLMFTFDNLGKDPYLSVNGKSNADIFAVWSAYFTWQPLHNSDWVMLTAGTFLPHLSRESTTTPWSVSSLDKAETSLYLRQFVTGKTNGVAPGINLGGSGPIGQLAMVYNVAMVSRQDKTNITRKTWNPVFMGHFMFNTNNSTKYKYTFSGNSLQKEKSISLGLGGSYQGETDIYTKNATWGADLQAYWGKLKLEAEYNRLYRKTTDSYSASCKMVRVGYNCFLQNGKVIEPTIMFSQFDGGAPLPGAAFYDGTDRLVDAGINYFIRKESLKLSLHYCARSGNGNSNYQYSEEGKTGNLLNFGVQIIL